jgi:hypothetical protein
MMRPQFDDKLKISADGQTVHASGPLALDDEDREAYMWVRIAQTGPDGTFAAEINHEIEDAPATLHAAQQAGTDLSWSVDVKHEAKGERPQAGEPTRFEPGLAHAEAWIVFLRNQGPGTMHVWWWENVMLEVEDAPAD